MIEPRETVALGGRIYAMNINSILGWKEERNMYYSSTEHSKEEILYHYCSVDTFFNVIKNAKLWLSDIEKSNDYRECVACREMVNEKIKEYLNNDKQALKEWKIGYEKGTQINYNSRILGVCFSESEDQLSQWRGYAQNGKGLAIGFYKKILETLNSIHEHDIKFGKVIYNNTEEYVRNIVKDNIAKFEYKGVEHVALELSTNYRLKFPFVKNSSFEEEKEWRAIVWTLVGHYNTPGSEKIAFSKLKYRTSNDKLIPYIEMDFEKIKQKIIRKIFIGPRSEIEIEDVFYFLKFCGYYDNSDGGYSFDNSISIRKSAISYR